jgi:hypothetical protein
MPPGDKPKRPCPYCDERDNDDDDETTETEPDADPAGVLWETQATGELVCDTCSAVRGTTRPDSQLRRRRQHRARQTAYQRSTQYDALNADD